jgi:uncharacterized protein YdbL (DUF1318 family)
MSSVDVFDERPGKAVAFRQKLHFDVTTTTVAEIIRARVTAECDAISAAAVKSAVIPGAVEETLNGYRPAVGQALDIEAEVAKAQIAFSRNQFFMFVNGRQAISLDEHVDLNTPVAATFLRLVPLVGG